MSAITEQLQQAVAQVILILLNPNQNMKAAVILYVIIGLLFGFVAVVGALFILSTPEKKPRGSGGIAKPSRAKRRVLSPTMRLIFGVSSVVMLFAVWVTAGVTMSDPGVCKSCHWPLAKHAAATVPDAHSRVACVDCHESGGVWGRYVAGVPNRVAHMAAKQLEIEGAPDYGQVTSEACTRCHQKSLLRTTLNPTRGLRISHAEPMAASAACTDCHALRGGVVGAYNGGMKQCLRCHDAEQASAKCDTCHTKKASAAARARSTAFRAVQVKAVKCGGCHDEKRECDTCHGVRMPHTDAFMGGGHARAAAVDFWFNSGKTCRKCHTATQRPCRCHTSLIGIAHGTHGELAKSHKNATASSCNSCHGQWAVISTRDFCKDICHSPEAIANSPR